ncbi:hypothetical protein ABDK00_001235 [Niabella insulamsoli]|uniref:hypothetical protein n=1 Tax=Niabella insulamsoli TaxID=3144874 RepID=UPI0031FCE5B5
MVLEKDKLKANEIRETLTKLVMAEMQKLPKLFEELEAKEKLDVLCKLLPFIAPKIEQIHPNDFNWIKD